MRWLLLSLLAVSGTAAASETTLEIPGQGWQLSFDAPSLTKVDEHDRPGQYMYEANAGTFNLSLYVEDPSCSGGNSHKDFYDCFWAKSSRNPMIVKPSVVATETPAYYKVAYDVEAPWEGKTVHLKNVNFLISYRGKWTDLHISVVEPTEADLALLTTFEKSLHYSPSTAGDPPATGARKTFDEANAAAQKDSKSVPDQGGYYMSMANVALPAMMACRKEAKKGPDPGFTVVLELDADGIAKDSWRRGDSPVATCFEKKMKGARLFKPSVAPYYWLQEIEPTP